jgi:WD40 repeat protein
VLNAWDIEKRRLVSPNASDEQLLDRAPLKAFSPSGDKVASANGESITISHAKTRRVITEKAEAHALPVSSLAFAPDGKTLASGSIDGTVKLWDAKNLNERPYDILVLRRLDRTLNSIRSLAFSPDGKRLALSDAGKTILWDLTTNKQLLELVGAQASQSPTFSGDKMAFGGRTLGRVWFGAPETDAGKSTTVVRKRASIAPGLDAWVSYRDGVSIQDDALIAGSETGPSAQLLRVCRLSFKNKDYVGYTSGEDCHFAPDGRQLNMGIYEVLTKPGAAVWLRDGGSGSEAVKKLTAGKQNGKEINVCRAGDGDSLYIGWVTDKECHLGNGLDVPAGKFEILHTRR